jgi:hypothetical protein
MRAQGMLTFLVIGRLEPAAAEETGVENFIPSLNDQGFATVDDVQQDELLKLFGPEVADLMG